MQRRNKFALIELLIVIAIIAILAAMLLPALGHARNMARTAACKANFKTIGTASMLYTDTYDGWIVTTMPKGWNPDRTWFCLLSGKNYSGSPNNNSAGFGVTYYGYRKTSGTVACPSEKIPFGSYSESGIFMYTHYVLNGHLAGYSVDPAFSGMRKITAVRKPTEAIFAGDSLAGEGLGIGNLLQFAYRHGGGEYRPLNSTLPPKNGSRTNILFQDGHVVDASNAELRLLKDQYNRSDNYCSMLSGFRSEEIRLW